MPMWRPSLPNKRISIVNLEKTFRFTVERKATAAVRLLIFTEVSSIYPSDALDSLGYDADDHCLLLVFSSIHLASML